MEGNTERMVSTIPFTQQNWLFRCPISRDLLQAAAWRGPRTAGVRHWPNAWRVGWWQFCARLLIPLCCRCATPTYRVAADVLRHLPLIDAGKSPETLRSHTLQVGEQLGDAAANMPPAAAVAAITLNLDSTLIRSREQSGRHLRRGDGEGMKIAARRVFAHKRIAVER
jgi:hypothetical protein